jgi:hypothetical protein
MFEKHKTEIGRFTSLKKKSFYLSLTNNAFSKVAFHNTLRANFNIPFYVQQWVQMQRPAFCKGNKGWRPKIKSEEFCNWSE